jgi:hypothetical protein
VHAEIRQRIVSRFVVAAERSHAVSIVNVHRLPFRIGDDDETASGPLIDVDFVRHVRRSVVRGENLDRHVRFEWRCSYVLVR